MYGLPASTEIRRRPIYRTVIARTLGLTAPQRRLLDTSISSIDLIALLSPGTLPGVALGEEVSAISVLSLVLKARSYSPDSIVLLARRISQRMLFVLRYEGEVRLAIYHEGLHQSAWMSESELTIPLSGSSLGQIWEHLVVMIGGLSPDRERPLGERIEERRRDEQILGEIKSLERRIRRESALNRQMELRSRINQLQARLSNHQ